MEAGRRGQPTLAGRVGRAGLAAALRAVAVAVAIGLVAAGGVAADRTPAGVEARYPGRIVRVDVGLCTLEAPAEAEAPLLALAGRARVILPALEADLGVRPAARYWIVLIPPGGSADPEVRALDAGAPAWAAGYFVPARRVGAVRLAQARNYPYGTPESVLAHEAAHVLLDDAAPGRLPLWFQEGVATSEGRAWSLEDVLVYSSSLLTTDLPELAELDSAFHASEWEARMAYAGAFAFVKWASRRYGASFVRVVVREAGRRPFAAAWEAAAGRTLAESERRWRRESLLRYRWIPILTASSTLWIIITLLALVAGVRRRIQVRATRARWQEQEERMGPPESGPE